MKVIKFAFFMTMLTLIYIHMQMQIFSLAYDGKQKERRITNLTEENGVMAYNILEMKSANNLGINLLAEDSDLQFRDRKSVVHLITLKPDEQRLPGEVDAPRKDQTLMSFLSSRFPKAAQAQEKKLLAMPWQR